MENDRPKTTTAKQIFEKKTKQTASQMLKQKENQDSYLLNLHVWMQRNEMQPVEKLLPFHQQRPEASLPLFLPLGAFQKPLRVFANPGSTK